jgi:hypothetical protein
MGLGSGGTQLPAAASAAVTSVDGVTANPAIVRVGETVSVVASAHAADGGALSYAWSDPSGPLAGSGPTLSWSAQRAPGDYLIQVVVTDSQGATATGAVVVSVCIAAFDRTLNQSLSAPQKIVAGAAGRSYVVDARAGKLLLLSSRGDLLGAAALPEKIVAAGFSGGRLFAITGAGRIFEADPRDGRLLSSVVAGGGSTAEVRAITFSPAARLLYIAERSMNRVRAVRLDGSLAFELTASKGVSVASPIDLAYDETKGLLWVLLEGGTGGLAHAFTSSGVYVRSAGSAGAGAGQVTRAGGIAVDKQGRVFVSDAFQGSVQAFDEGGAPLGAIGAFGSQPGQLLQPVGLSVDSRGQLLVANVGARRIDQFGSSLTPLPCPGDSDCDGIPDWWEIKFGLNPFFAGDALQDLDGDGLTNLQEYLRGTNPRKRDTDGDGFSDGDEVAAGYDPLNGRDHVARLTLTGPQSAGPGLSRISAQIVNPAGGRCSLAWSQLSGAAVPVQQADEKGLAFVARTQGKYLFQAVPTCGASRGTSAVAEVRVGNAAPALALGRPMVVRSTLPFDLTAAASDGNGDSLSFQWEQTGGAAVVTSAKGASLRGYPAGPGLLEFALAATDPAGASTARTQTILLLDKPALDAFAVVASPISGASGRAVSLDGSGSQGAALSFQWVQTDGPAAALSGAAAPVASFTPSVPGRYAFELALTSGGVALPPAQVEVFVAPTGQTPPTPVAAPALTGSIGMPLSLDASASLPGSSPSPLLYSWRQVGGPAAGLTDVDQAVATVVPFGRGRHLFEVTVAQAGVFGPPALVHLDVGPLPTAAATGPGTSVVGAPVRLSGTATGATAPRFHWAQVDGPWAVLDGAETATPSFLPTVAGLYRFELEVADGSVRGVPAQVSVLVFDNRTGVRP